MYQYQTNLPRSVALITNDLINRHEKASAEQIISFLIIALQSKDNFTCSHCERVAILAESFGTFLSLSTRKIRDLKRGAYIHDIGKIGIPDSVLMKPGKLNPLEYEVMKTHTIIGERICKPLKPLRGVLPIIRSHHERWDGTGYPDGLKGSSIPFLAQIFQFIDIYDSLTSDRPYKKSFSKEEAVEILWEETDRGWRNREIMKQFSSFIFKNC